MVRPELLGLPSLAGSEARSFERAIQSLSAALIQGDSEQARRLVLNLYIAGRSAVKICDRVLAPTFHALGDAWSHGVVEVYQERRGCEIVERLLFELRSLLPKPALHAPRAFGATLWGDPYRLPTAMVELVLREAGWAAESFGTGVPADTLRAAVVRCRPRLVWVSGSHIERTEDFVADVRRLYRATRENRSALVLGGQALDEDLLGRVQCTAHCPRLQHLLNLAETLLPHGGFSVEATV